MKRFLVAMALLACVAGQVQAAELVNDPFESFDTVNVWEPGEGMTIQGMLPYWDKYDITYAGPIDSVTPITFDTRTAVQLWSDLGDLQRNAYRTREEFAGLTEARLELVFLPVGGVENIDGIMELGMLNTTTGDQVHVGIWGGNWGDDRFAYAGSEIQGVYEMASGWTLDVLANGLG